MVGENDQYGNPPIKIEMNDNRHDFLKKKVLETPAIINGAIGVVINDANLHGKPIAEISAADVLRYLFPTNERLWRDEELLCAAQESLEKKRCEKNIMNKECGNLVPEMSADEKAAEIRRIKNITSQKGAARNAYTLGEDKDE